MFHNKFIFKVSWSSDTLRNIPPKKKKKRNIPPTSSFSETKQLSKGRETDLNCDGTKNEDNEK